MTAEGLQSGLRARDSDQRQAAAEAQAQGAETTARAPPWLQLACDGPVTARIVQGMARVQSGQAPAWPLFPDRSVRRDIQGQA